MASQSSDNALRSHAVLRELMASVVVFLVALPLCMGIAIASGVPPALGLVTGMVGGLVVGAISGQPLQVSGPAAGLTVLVWQLVERYGVEALGIAVAVGGALQLVAGTLGLGRWFRAVAPAVIQGMLAGIGVLIFASQFHVMLGDTPRGSGLQNLLTIPAAVSEALVPRAAGQHHMAALIGVITVATLLVWNRFRPRLLHSVPGALVGVAVGTLGAQALALPIELVSVPETLLDSLNMPALADMALLLEPGFAGMVVGLAVIASAETLLCATAVDRLHDGPRTRYEKELRAQGVGNLICGGLGALPMTGVIVRSSANVEAGAKTRWSAVVHGLWLLILVAALPGVLSIIPTASLAAILVYTGYRLINPAAVAKLARVGKAEVLIWMVTVVAIVTTNLLAGIAIGFALALGRLLYTLSHMELQQTRVDGVVHLAIRGAASFMTLPRLAETLEALADDTEVHVHVGGLAHIDHACLELLDDWRKRRRGRVKIEWEELERRLKSVRFPHAA